MFVTPFYFLCPIPTRGIITILMKYLRNSAPQPGCVLPLISERCVRARCCGDECNAVPIHTAWHAAMISSRADAPALRHTHTQPTEERRHTKRSGYTRTRAAQLVKRVSFPSSWQEWASEHQHTPTAERLTLNMNELIKKPKTYTRARKFTYGHRGHERHDHTVISLNCFDNIFL